MNEKTRWMMCDCPAERDDVYWGKMNSGLGGTRKNAEEL
jgi:hypothetical protein